MLKYAIEDGKKICTQCGEVSPTLPTPEELKDTGWRWSKAGQKKNLIPIMAWRRVVEYLHRHRILPQKDWHTGVACRDCGGELVAPTLTRIKMSMPPLLDVVCKECGDNTYIVYPGNLDITYEKEEPCQQK